MEEDHLKVQLRRERREDRLGKNPACGLCGHSNPTALQAANRSLLEKHHIVGKAHDASLTLLVCRNCHAELAEGARDAGADMRRQPTFLHRLAMILRALGSLFIALGEAMCRHANDLFRLIAGLDEDCAHWRRLPDAK
jgi:hypothetical protein